jgi:hypothetical protein
LRISESLLSVLNVVNEQEYLRKIYSQREEIRLAASDKASSDVIVHGSWKSGPLRPALSESKVRVQSAEESGL